MATGPTLAHTVNSQLSLFPDERSGSEEVLGFNNRRISPTNSLNLPEHSPYEVAYSDLDPCEKRYVDMVNEQDGFAVGVSISLFPSGEFTAACTALGPKPQKQKKPRGQISSIDLSSTAKKVTKRAIQNHWRLFNRMFTFTFDPKLSKNVYNDDGTINHEYAHKEISRTLEAARLKYQRLYEKVMRNTKGKSGKNFQLSLIRISEIQPETGNIHFHVLADRHVDIQYLVKLWGQASNSVQVDKVNGMRALKYLFKYLKKGGCLIYGKRYSLTLNLYDEFEPQKVRITGRYARSIFLNFIQSRGATILDGRGYLGDWGFSLPPPNRKGVPSSSHKQFILELAEALDDAGYPDLLRVFLSEYESEPSPF